MLVNKLLWTSNKKSHFVGALLGSLLGLILLLLSIQLYTDFRQILTAGENLLQPEYLVINKRVSAFTAFNTKAYSFSRDEINQLSSQPFVKEVTPFVSNSFKVSAFTSQTRNIPAFYTELFFESVEDKYLDINKPEWIWSPDAQFVPIILPKDYLNLYNFGFSESQGLPKISEGMIGLLTFTLRLEGSGMVKEMPAKIIGFSNRINSILVPYSFMQWANKTLGNNHEQAPQRLIMVARNPSDPAIIKYLDKKNYETNTEKLKNSKVMVIVNIITSVLSGIALLIVFLSFMNFMLGFQVLLFRSAEKIRLLLLLGYKPSRIRNLYAIYYIAAMSVIVMLSFGAILIIKQKMSDYLLTFRIEGPETINIYVIIAGLGITCLLILLTFFNLNRQLKIVDGR